VPPARAAHAEALALADIALLTLDDEQLLHGDATAEAALQRALALECAELVVKRGRAPTLVRNGSEGLHEVPTLGVDPVIDTTAAGDSFAGAYLAARLTGATAPEAVAAGNRLAATVIQHRGAIIPGGAMPATATRAP
jgi:2-dehydro-3-deoxygluconokinase